MSDIDEGISRYLLTRFKEAAFHPPRPSFSLEPVFRYMAKKLVHFLYNIKATGFEKIPETGPVLLISNHLSYMDGLIISSICKRHLRFIIDRDIYSQPLINYFMRMDRAIPIAPKKESVEKALDMISEGLQNGDAICIFPEGQITYTGFMSHFRPGTEWIIKRDPVPVYPVILHGLWGSMFSRKYLNSFLRFIPKHLGRRKVLAVCGDSISPHNVTTDELQVVMLRLRAKALAEIE